MVRQRIIAAPLVNWVLKLLILTMKMVGKSLTGYEHGPHRNTDRAEQSVHSIKVKWGAEETCWCTSHSDASETQVQLSGCRLKHAQQMRHPSRKHPVMYYCDVT